MKVNIKVNRSTRSKIIDAILIILAIVILGFIISLAIKKVQVNSAKNEAKESLKSFIEALKNEDEEQISKLNLKKKLNNAVFSQIEYDIKRSDGDLNTQKVIIEIKNKDMKVVMDRYRTLKTASKGTELQNQIEDSAIKQIIEAKQTPIVTNEIEVEMVKENDNWKIANIEDENFINGLLPGIQEYLDSPEDNFNEFMNNLF